MDLKKIVSEKVGALGLPVKYDIYVFPHDEIRPNYKSNDSQYIQINIGSKRENSYDDCTCTHLDFWCDNEKKIIDGVKICMKGDLEDKGFARGLIEAMEDTGRDLRYSRIDINLSTKDSLWRHMKYVYHDGIFSKKL